MLNFVLLVACILIAIVSLLYLFFWNRFLGLCLGYFVRIAFWTQTSSAVWVDFGAVQWSLLAGRVLLRDVRYHSSNQTFRIVKCQISWRYWVRRAAEEEDLADDEESFSGKSHTRSLPCRIHITIQGLEWFMYNRTAAYDSIFTHLASSEPGFSSLNVKSRESNIHSMNQSVQERDKGFYLHARAYNASRRALQAIQLPSGFSRCFSWVKRQLPDLDPRSLLPLSIEITKGAITIGNHAVDNLLLAQFSRAEGTFGVVQSLNKLDIHKQLLRLSFKDAVVSCVENGDHWASVQSIGKDVYEMMDNSRTNNTASSYLSFRGFLKSWHKYRDSFAYFKHRTRRYVNPEKPKKKGHRTHEEESHIGADFSKLEYAIDRKLFESPCLEVMYYADVAGTVPVHPVGTGAVDLEYLDIGNSGSPPEWGAEVICHGGSIRYGPWADRQRVQLQRMFFPPSFSNSSETPRLTPGDLRRCTCFKLFLEFRGVTTLHIPFREASKNWQWDGVKNIPQSRKLREAASIQLRVGNNSTLKYLVPMVATRGGYAAEFDLVLDNVSVTSSLNDIRLLETPACFVSSSMPSPLRWDQQRSWIFNISMDRPVLYIIRDHINMLTDLGRDWSSGPPSDFNTFIPMIYGVNIIMNGFELNMYANDHNIIDRPLDRQENVLTTYKGDILKSEVRIPLNKFRPLATTVSFFVDSPDISLFLTLPRWNTHSLYVPDQVSHIGRVSSFRIDGSYSYHSEVRFDCIDQLKLNLSSKKVVFKLFGFAVRHLMVWRDDYFGSFTQYSTTREYLYKRDNGLPVGDPLELKYREGKNNTFHLDFAVHVENGTVLMPVSLLGYEKFNHNSKEKEKCSKMGLTVVYGVPELEVQLRLFDSGLEMSLNTDPIKASITDIGTLDVFSGYDFAQTKSQFSIAGIDITADRLFGPPPRAATYVCIWNIHLGVFRGVLSTLESRALFLALRSFLHGFEDPLNAPASTFSESSDRDITMMKLRLDGADFCWSTESSALRILLSQGLTLDFNNVAGIRFRKMFSVRLPSIELQVLFSPNSSRRWLEVGHFECSVDLDIFRSPKGWFADAEKQKKFVDAQDISHRLTGLLSDGGRSKGAKTNWHNTVHLREVQKPLLSLKPSAVSPNRRSHRALSGIKERLRSGTFSDSDEEWISEYDRDMRLANSKPIDLTSRPHSAAGDQDTSSLDESDEAASETSENSLSDYFDLLEDCGLSNEKSQSYFPHYWKFCRQYEVIESQRSFGPGFVIVNESCLPLRRKLFSKNFPPNDSFTAGVKGNGGDENSHSSDDTSHSRIRARVDGVDAFFTPLLLIASRQMDESFHANDLALEFQIDAILLDMMGSPTGPSSTDLDVIVQGGDIRVLQDLMTRNVFEGLNSPKSSEIKTNDKGSRLVSVIELSFSSANVLALLPSKMNEEAHRSGRLCLKGFFAAVGSIFSTPTSARLTSFPDEPSASLYVESFSALVGRERGDLSLEVCMMRLHRNSPEVILSTIRELAVSAGYFVGAIEELSQNVLNERRRLLHRVLAAARDIPAKDLLSAVQPSFLVQRGRPRELRQDINWKYLFHLRHFVESVPTDDVVKASPLEVFPTIEEMKSQLQEYNAPWTLDGERIVIADIPVFRKLFDLQSEGASEHVKLPPELSPNMHLSVQLGNVQVVFEDPDVQAKNSILITSTIIDIDALPRKLIVPLNSIHPLSSTARSAGPGEIVPYKSLCIVLGASLGSLQIAIFPNILMFLRNAIHIWRRIFQDSKPTPTKTTSVRPRTIMGIRLDDKLLSCDLRFSLRSLLLEAAAENIIFELASIDFASSTLIHASIPITAKKAKLDLSVNHSHKCEQFTVKARTRAFSDRSRRSDDDVLAGILFSSSTLCVLHQTHSSQGRVFRSTLKMNALDITVPRSAIRLYHFIEQWRQDYLHGIDAMMQSLFNEIRRASKKSAVTTKVDGQRSDSSAHSFDSSIAEVSIGLQVMRGTWLSWSVHDIVTYCKMLSGTRTSNSFGFQLASQRMQIISLGSIGAADASQGRKISLDFGMPSIKASGSYSESQFRFLALMGFLQMTVKPSHWDALLSVQQKFGQDFNDLLSLIEQKRRKKLQSEQRSSSQPVPFNVTGRFEGFRIGLEGFSSTQYLECEDIDAVSSSSGKKNWEVTMKNLSLYLCPRYVDVKSNSRPEVRRSYPLLIDVDFQATGFRATANQDEVIEILISKFHAVLQPNLISEIGDYFDYLQAEVLLRQEQRALELQEFKLKARKVMETFNMNPYTSATKESTGFLGTRNIKVAVLDFGIAFPLELLNLSSSPMLRGELVTKAFLLSIKSLAFRVQQGKTGQALMKTFCFQFVSRFRPSVAADFSSDKHHTFNMLLYPEMTARVVSDNSLSSRHLFLSAEISGFILDLEPSITNFVFSLIDLYRHGKERVDKLTAGMPRSTSETESFLSESPKESSRGLNLASSVAASLTFASGKVRMHTPMQGLTGSDSSPEWYGRSYEMLDPEAEILSLPEVSVWCEYRTARARVEANNLKQDDVSPVLVLKSTIHSSSNTLRPSLLPFVTRIMHNVEKRMKEAPLLPGKPVTLNSTQKPQGGAEDHLSNSQMSSLQMIFSLRLDKSKLELTCKPDVNVVAGLHWESGGLIVNVSPGAKGVTVTGTISGLTAGLKHGFLSEDCANLDARDLNLSINFSKSELASGDLVNCVSVVIDTEFSGSVRFSRLQDFLCFKAVWLDHIPVLSGEAEDAPSSPSTKMLSTVSNNERPKRGYFDTALVIRVREIKLEADLGQSISVVTFELRGARARTRLTEEVSEISISIDRVDTQARGNLSGHLRMPDFLFRTVRRRQGPRLDRHNLGKMLELNMTSGTLDIQLQSDWLWLLQYRAEPLEAVIYDDWTLVDPSGKIKDRQLHLNFSVVGTKVIALMTIMAIPKLVMYAGKFMANLEIQREGAARESSVFRSTRLPKAENALSEVANAMIQTAKTKFKEADQLSYVVGQRMRLKLDELVFVLLPRSQGDNELARFIGRDVMAQLDRTVQPDGTPVRRELLLTLTRMAISQLVRQGLDPRLPGQEFDMLTASARNASAIENVIFSLPAMDMRMVSDEEFESGSKAVLYDFDSKFVRREGQKNMDNISISFNIALYSWLTVLRKTFAREFKRAQEVAEWRAERATFSGGFQSMAVSRTALSLPNMEPTDVPRSSRPSTPSPVEYRTPRSGTSPTKSVSQPARATSPPYRASEATSRTGKVEDASGASNAQKGPGDGKASVANTTGKKSSDIIYKPRHRRIERLTVRQLGEATPDVMHPFFTKKAGFNLEESLPQYVHEYATLPIEEIMNALIKIYSKQLRSGKAENRTTDGSQSDDKL